MSYAKYLNDLMNLWAGWSKSVHMRKYLYLSLALVAAVGVVIGAVLTYTVGGVYSPLGVPVAFLLISGYDWLRQRRIHRRYAPIAPTVQPYVSTLEDTTELHLDDEEEDFSEDFDDDECDCGHDHGGQGSVDHMPDDETHN